MNTKEIQESLLKLTNKSNNITLYLIALLFSIEFTSTWLIIIFSIFLSISILKRLNMKYKFIQIKFKKK